MTARNLGISPPIRLDTTARIRRPWSHADHYSLVREYGRIGQPGKLRLDSYPDAPQAVNALNKLLRAKTRRGYQPLTGRSI